jgi:hypothetical protein
MGLFQATTAILKAYESKTGRRLFAAVQINTTESIPYIMQFTKFPIVFSAVCYAYLWSARKLVCVCNENYMKNVCI